MNKTHVLFVYTKMVVGGSTTSLLSILNNVDYDRYEVTLLLMDSSGDLQYMINPNVSIIEASRVNIKKRILNPKALFYYLFAELTSRYNKNRLLKAQINSTWIAKAMPQLRQKFDVAISFLEFWPQRFVAYKVRARKKICWLHIDPKEAGLKASYSRNSLAIADNIVLVSNSCKQNFDEMFPEYSNKSVVIENILDARIIRQLSQEKCDIKISRDKVNFVSVCRINLASKALDRVVRCMEHLKNQGIDIEKRIDWYIIGEGPDESTLRTMVRESGLINIFFLGKQLNPYKYEKHMDCFILPSKYEGKPMAITEAQMLGVVPLVCRYSSAPEQINNYVDGIIVPNDDYSMCIPLREIAQGKIDILKYHDEILKKDYSNTYVINQIFSLMD